MNVMSHNDLNMYRVLAFRADKYVWQILVVIVISVVCVGQTIMIMFIAWKNVVLPIENKSSMVLYKMNYDLPFHHILILVNV